MFDVLIAGGDVYDGSGAGPVPADVGVCGDRVAAACRARRGPSSTRRARRCALASSTSSATRT